MSTQNENSQNISTNQLTSGSWKQKIQALDRLTQQTKLRETMMPPQQLEPIWPELLKESNFNVLKKVVSTLETWTLTFGVRSVRVQRELLKPLLGLSRLGRPEINASVTSIVIGLFLQERQVSSPTKRQPLGMIDCERFSSFNNPTFLFGSEQPDSMVEQQEEGEPETEPEKNTPAAPASFVLCTLLESMKSCQKNSFALCLRIILKMQEKSLLTTSQFQELMREVREVSDVIEHRREPECKDRKVDEEIVSLVQELRLYE